MICARLLLPVLSFIVCLIIHHGSLCATPPFACVYQVSSPYTIILPGQQVFLRAYFSDHDFGETYDIEWDFGDGTKAGETLRTSYDCYANPGRCTPYKYGCFSYMTTSYSYKDPGTYKITITVVDSKSERGRDLRTLRVVGPGEVVERLMSSLRETPKEAFMDPETKDELINALGMVHNNLKEEPVEALGIIKNTIMPKIAKPCLRNRHDKKLMEVIPLFEALASHLSLQHAS